MPVRHRWEDNDDYYPDHLARMVLGDYLRAQGYSSPTLTVMDASTMYARIELLARTLGHTVHGMPLSDFYSLTYYLSKGMRRVHKGYLGHDSVGDFLHHDNAFSRCDIDQVLKAVKKLTVQEWEDLFYQTAPAYRALSQVRGPEAAAKRLAFAAKSDAVADKIANSLGGPLNNFVALSEEVVSITEGTKPGKTKVTNQYRTGDGFVSELLVSECGINDDGLQIEPLASGKKDRQLSVLSITNNMPGKQIVLTSGDQTQSARPNGTLILYAYELTSVWTVSVEEFPTPPVQN